MIFQYHDFYSWFIESKFAVKVKSMAIAIILTWWLIKALTVQNYIVIDEADLFPA